MASLGKAPAGVFHKKILPATIRVGNYMVGCLRRAWKTSGEPTREVSMELKNRVIVVTGAARGIGRALATRFASAEPLAVFIADIDGLRLAEVAREIGATAIQCDVSRESDIHHLITHVESTHGRIDVFCSDAGIRVSCLCPQGVKTDMLAAEQAQLGVNFLTEGALEPEAVAQAVVQGIAEERFLILPHPEVAEYFRRKADDYDRWLRGMRRLRKSLVVAPG